ncbi:ATP-dependent RNA helicase DbpA [Massilia sp. Dwa41.01b]|uniref:ATP-dependent RNA helicase DbpA n=1 Tax=unclassified Massilia TaxID=2609279 RepID=UPI0016008E43|nr:MULTISPECIES: ATP-dependent RNA helicase DbpA [unclassified Massilia]QNA89579.1 ATP-dependent RNA helicase DbpA [Massilia sp. Dwa41.01b]QNB00478.1 ATP-dependent RNA helicase DbpA [Massilia sp. Se16.2.3]
MTTSFSALPLAPQFLANLGTLGYNEMTPIQAESLPAVLEGRDLIAQAATGSGKTAAFGIGILNKLNPAWFAVQGLVLCPTRELADQVAGELRRLARGVGNVKILTLTGGVAMRPQIASLEHGAHIVVGTPGRIRDHLGRATLDLSKVQTLVLDEADRMTDMGFYDEIANIVTACPQRRQTLLFSATYPDDIRHATAGFLVDPLEVVVESRHDDSKIEQRFYEVGFDNRDEAVARLLRHYRPVSALAFCNTKAHCRELADTLRDQGFSALALYGELEQRERDEILILFANRSCSVLVATDVAARGLDIANLEAVINVDVSKDAEVHVHRIGRTGRGSETGLALSLCAPNEKKWVRLIEEMQGSPASWYKLDDLGDSVLPAEPAPMMTLVISGGKKDKLRPGDVLGALTGDAGLAKEQVGKINVTEFQTYVAIAREAADMAFRKLNAGNRLGPDFGNFKGRSFKMRFLEL